MQNHGVPPVCHAWYLTCSAVQGSAVCSQNASVWTFGPVAMHVCTLCTLPMLYQCYRSLHTAVVSIVIHPVPWA
jgi:hypothetical protein